MFIQINSVRPEIEDNYTFWHNEATIASPNHSTVLLKYYQISKILNDIFVHDQASDEAV